MTTIRAQLRLCNKICLWFSVQFLRHHKELIQLFSLHFIRPLCHFSHRLLGRGCDKSVCGCVDIVQILCNYKTFSIQYPQFSHRKKSNRAGKVPMQTPYDYCCSQCPLKIVCLLSNQNMSSVNSYDCIMGLVQYILWHGFRLMLLENVYNFQLNKIIEDMEPDSIWKSHSRCLLFHGGRMKGDIWLGYRTP